MPTTRALALDAGDVSDGCGLEGRRKGARIVSRWFALCESCADAERQCCSTLLPFRSALHIAAAG